jgi:hypothetical protein
LKRKSDRPLRKHTLNLFDGEFDRLQEIYGLTGASAVIRTLIHNHLKRCEEKIARKMEELDLRTRTRGIMDINSDTAD